MTEEKQRRLEAAGWVVGDFGDLLGLTPEEVAEIDARIAEVRRLTYRGVSLSAALIATESHQTPSGLVTVYTFATPVPGASQ